MRIIKLYECEICGKQYYEREGAEICEQIEIETPLANEGDAILYYDILSKDWVKLIIIEIYLNCHKVNYYTLRDYDLSHSINIDGNEEFNNRCKLLTNATE